MKFTSLCLFIGKVKTLQFEGDSAILQDYQIIHYVHSIYRSILNLPF